MSEKRNILVSLPTLSNNDWELKKEAVLSAQETGREQDPPVGRAGNATDSRWQHVLPNRPSEEKTVEEKKEVKKGLVYMWWHREEGLQNGQEAS